ncbi:hypothetical protein [Armatimonas sp.]|uniref:hypothetical protein n=1 Tax=Armatimonas sp. TaxID=1872638 RepID=UPI00286AF36B|nr:hypothetical protein [Armatimonas sp.]
MKPRITKAPKKVTGTAKPVTLQPSAAASSTPAKPAAVKAPTAKPKLVSRPKPKTIAKLAPKPVETPILGPPVAVVTPAPTTVSTNGPLHQIPPESPSLPVEQPGTPAAPIVPPLIIMIPPESPAPPAEAAILTSSGDKKTSGYAVVESEVTPPAIDAAVPTGYIVVESDASPSVSEAQVPPASEDATKPANYLVVESEIKTQVVGDAAVPNGYTVIESETVDASKPGYSVVESDSTLTATVEGTDPVAPQPTPSVPTVTIPTGKAMDEVSSFQIGDVLIIAVRVQPTPAPEVEP